MENLKTKNTVLHELYIGLISRTFNLEFNCCIVYLVFSVFVIPKKLRNTSDGKHL